MHVFKWRFLFLILMNAHFTINAQVNLQTGAADVNIPLYSYSNANTRLSTGVSLRYTAGNGVKVNDVASEVGTGWELDYGGVIVRMQKGEPDDQKQEGTFPYPNQNAIPPINLADYNHYINNYYPNGYMYSEFDPAQAVDNGGGYIPLFENPTQYKQKPFFLTDREQDVFALVFNGRSANFIIGKNGEIKTLVDSKLKIEKVVTDMSVDNIITRISEFHVTDETGIKYIFKDLELNEVIQYKRQYGEVDISNVQITYPITSNNYTTDVFRGEGKNKFVVGKWFLSEIINPLINKKIIFTYDSYNVDVVGNKTGNVSVTNSRTDVSLTFLRTKGITKRIKTIKLSEKEELEFVYNSANRMDLSFSKALDQIVVKYDAEIKLKWKFNFGYFVNNTIKASNASFTQDEKYQSRLCLQSVQKIGADNITGEPPYKFEYFIGLIPTLNGTILQDFDYKVSPMFSFYQNHWGFSIYEIYNNNNFLNQPRTDFTYSNINWTDVENITKNYLYARDFNSVSSKSGVIRKIQYPSGGKLSYEYEKNSATIPITNQQVSVGGIRVLSTTLFDGINHEKDIVKEYNYTTSSGTSSGWGFESFNYLKTKSNRIYK